MTAPAESTESVEQRTVVWCAMVLDRDPGVDVRDLPGIAVRWADCRFVRLAARRREALPAPVTSARTPSAAAPAAPPWRRAAARVRAPRRAIGRARRSPG
ncbi:hypothetical protein TPA0910_82120 [Streptomyces hygroscopicus subsp. sporocinereus]|uniref:Uncharacterized protein n=1 Tax=Streptomyces hygroscopicus TaxID=1912 RepID=A0ABQ3UDX8_STRHY|nr:hypothetical protein TPA0910_82120 [Streptomyces hygroscopicus]